MKIREIAARTNELQEKWISNELEDQEEIDEFAMGIALLVNHVLATEAVDAGRCQAISPETLEAMQLMQKRYQMLMQMMRADVPKLEREIDVEIARHQIVVVPKGAIIQ